MAACDFDKSAAHRSHARRSGPGGKRSRITRRNAICAARRMAVSCMTDRIVQSPWIRLRAHSRFELVDQPEMLTVIPKMLRI
jgi:hypothetical protein